MYLFHYIGFIWILRIISILEILWKTCDFTYYFCGQQSGGSGGKICELRGEGAWSCPWDQGIDYGGKRRAEDVFAITHVWLWPGTCDLEEFQSLGGKPSGFFMAAWRHE